MGINRAKHILLLVLFCTIAVSAFAQKSVVITGTIVSDAEGPLIMASITERDDKNRIVTAEETYHNGNFSMVVKNTDNRLQVSYIGHKTQTLPIGSRRVFNIEMTKSAAQSEDALTNHKKTTQEEQKTNSNFLYSMDSTFLIALVAIAVVVVLSVFFHYVPFVLWLSAKVSGVHISFRGR